jgi:hypothetical protein
MTFLKQSTLLALAACLGLFLAGCQPSDPDSPNVAKVSSIAVTPNPVNMEIGGFRALIVTGTFSDGKSYALNSGTTFASSAPAIATVDASTGYVTAVAAGTATITATHTESGKTGTTAVTVSPLRTLSIAVTPATNALAVGATQALTVTATYNNLTTGPVTAGSTFVSSNSAVATVSDTGIVTGVAEGSATITATHTASGKTATAAVTVSTGGGGGGGFTPITFDSAGTVYTLTGFGDAAGTLVPDPTDGSNIVAQVVKSPTAELWAGVTVSTGENESVGKIPFTSTSTKMTVRVYSPRAGIPVRLKVEDAADDTRSVETEALTTLVNTWETLTFDFANHASGTAPLNLAYTYNRVSIFFDFGKTGADGGAGTFYFDDVTFATGGASGNTGTCTDACIDFAGAEVKYKPFEDLVSAEQADDPVDATNQVAKFVKGPDGAPWAGATIYTIDANMSVPEFDLSASKIVTLRVYSPMAGMNVRMKLEDAGNNGIYLEKDVLTTKANEWETLSFDFATPVNGVYDPANTYDRVSLFPAFSITEAPASNVTVYFDELDYTATGGGGGGGGGSGSTGTCTAPNCTDFSSGGIGFGVFENPGGGTVEVAEDPNDPTNYVVKFVKKTGDNDYFGTTITGLAGPAELTATNKTVTLRVYSPTVGTNFLLKLEGGPGGAVVEKDMVTTVAGAWETLSFDLSAGAAGTYATVVLFPNGRSKVATDKTMYIDELKFPASGGGGGGSSGDTGTCTDAACIDFSEPGIGFGPFENGGGGTVAIVDDPNNAANKVVQFVKKPGDGDYFGTTITGLGGSVVLTSSEKTVTMRVYSPAAGTNFLLKFEGGTGGPATTEKDAATTLAGAWETLSFVMPDAGTYPVVVLFPNGRSSVAADKTMYVDELRFPAFSTGGGGGSGGFVNGIFANDYVGDLFVNAKSTQGGDVGFFFDPRLAKDVGATYDYAGLSGTAQNPGGVPNFYYGLGLNAPAITDAYFGAFLKAPGNGTVDVSGFANIRVNVWGPDQLFKAGTFPALDVILQGPAVSGCGSPSGGSEVQVTFNTTGQGADKVYALPLSSFTLTTACSGEATVAQVLANIAQVNILLKNANIQYVNKDPDGVAFTNGLNVGSITFN